MSVFLMGIIVAVFLFWHTICYLFAPPEKAFFLMCAFLCLRVRARTLCFCSLFGRKLMFSLPSFCRCHVLCWQFAFWKCTWGVTFSGCSFCFDDVKSAAKARGTKHCHLFLLLKLVLDLSSILLSLSLCDFSIFYHEVCSRGHGLSSWFPLRQL